MGSRILFGIALLQSCALVSLAKSGVLRVSEPDTVVRLEDGSAPVTLAIHEVSSRFRASVRAEWLDPNDRILASSTARAVLKPGRNAVTVHLPSPLTGISASKHSSFLWHRIRYTIRNSSTQARVSSGVLSVSQIRSNFFVLHLYPQLAETGHGHVAVLVRAVHPLTNEPTPQVRITGGWQQRAGKQSQPIVVTDSSGMASLKIPVPANHHPDTSVVVVRGIAGGYETTSQLIADVNAGAPIRIDTDKGIYQPGQRVQIRVLALGLDGKPVANRSIQLSIRSDRRADHKQTVTTSRFGVGATEWVIPDNAPTGSYVLIAEMDRDGETAAAGSVQVEVRRYELPRYRITAVPDKPWYAHGEKVTIHVAADFVFGKPVPSGDVTIVEAMQDSNPGGREPLPVSVNLEAGKATVEFTPSLANSNGNKRDYSVRFSGPDGRIEERRFSLIVAAMPIQLELPDARRLSSVLPVPFHLRATYLDGSPAECVVKLTLESSGKRLQHTLRTNRLGVARLDSVTAPGPGLFKIEAEAWDGQARRGETRIEEIANGPGAILETEKYLHRAGDPVRATLRASKDGVYIVTVLKQRAVVDLRLVNVVGGLASVVLPYRQPFDGIITLQAYAQESASFEEETEQAPLDAVSLWFEQKPALDVRVVPAREEYRPGERARTEVVVSSDGKPVEAAVGLAVIDKAVEEQSRSLGMEPESEDPDELLAKDLNRSLGDFEGDILAGALLPVVRDSILSKAIMDGPSDIYRERVHKDLRIVGKGFNRWLAAGHSTPQTLEDVTNILRTRGVNLHSLRDPWQTPYAFKIGVENEWMSLEARSSGPDRVWGTNDDLVHQPAKWHWFSGKSRRISEALRRLEAFPRTEAEFRAAMLKAGLIPLLKDLQGEGLQIRILAQPLTISDTNVFTYEEYRSRRRTPGSAIVQTIEVPRIEIRTRLANRSDPPLASFIGPPANETLQKLLNKPRRKLSGQRGAYRGGIQGIVVDATGAPIPNAHVEITSPLSRRIFVTRASSTGEFVAFLASGTWVVRVESPGFKAFAALDVPVSSGILTGLNVELEVGAVYQQIDITSEVPQVMISTSSSAPRRKPVASVRKYFPETLVWMPMIETGTDGRAAVDIDLADSITTWKATAIASSLDGRVAEGTQDIRAFQSLFVDYSIPHSLTVGDEITMPIAVRNYTASDVSATTSMQASEGLEVVGGGESAITVRSGESSDALIRLKATKPSIAASMKATASTGEAKDGMQHTLPIRPDGLEVTQAATADLKNSRTIVVEIPEAAIPGSPKARLRVYPTLASHIFESRDAILQRPYGCAEQTISSTYPNLLLLDLLKDGDASVAGTRAAAMRNLQAGYDRLLGYQDESGGFTYFGHTGTPDPMVTAYAIEFLNAAGKYLNVDREAIRAAVGWLWSVQLADGTWQHGGPLDAVTIAAQLLESGGGPKEGIKRVLALEEMSKEMDGPYLLASRLRIYVATKDLRKVESTARSLFSLMDPSGRWTLDGSTPFHSWGRIGGIEATAVVTAALQKARETGVKGLDAAIRLGVNALLRAKDELGTWHSSHTTIRVLLALAGMRETFQADGDVSLAVNGTRLESVHFSTLIEYRDIDVLKLLRTGRNTFEVTSSGNGFATASVSASWHIPWSSASAEPAGLQLSVTFDKGEATINELIQCSVSVQRSDILSRGMLVVDVGLPPGSEVDRESLEALVRDRSTRVQRYELQPDRVLLYLWPERDRVVATFNFLPRYAMTAKAAPSSAWDYYNPDARAVVAPVLFRISDK